MIVLLILHLTTVKRMVVKLCAHFAPFMISTAAIPAVPINYTARIRSLRVRGDFLALQFDTLI